MPNVVAVVNQKGGVGKTTVVAGLASAARHLGHRVLLVDLDPQGALTWICGVDTERVKSTLADAVASGKAGAAAQVVRPSEWGHLVDVVPSDPALQRFEAIRGGLETLLGNKTELRLRRALEGVRSRYGVVLVDCPPSLGDLTTNALGAADEAVIVAEPSAFSLRGVAGVAALVDQVEERHNPGLALSGVVVNRMPGRGNDAQRQLEELAGLLGRASLLLPPVPQRIAVAEAATNRRPVHDLGARGAEVAAAFDALYDQIWTRLKGS